MASRIDKFTMFMDGLFYFEVGVRFIAAQKKKKEEKKKKKHTHAQRRYSDASPPVLYFLTDVAPDPSLWQLLLISH